MKPITNVRLLVRILSAGVCIAVVGFVCGYFGPLLLLPDPGIGPITGFLVAPVGAAVGVVAAIWASVAATSGRSYVYRVVAVALAFGATVILLVISQ